jgi:hypothetical protein
MVKFVLIQLVLILSASAFTKPSLPTATTRPLFSLFVGRSFHEPTISCDIRRPDSTPRKEVLKVLGLLTFLFPNVVIAATEVELADLPPPWIPVVFGLGLVAVSMSLVVDRCTLRTVDETSHARKLRYVAVILV